jgi:hypothetical protein
MTYNLSSQEDALKSAGYTWKYNADGYQVFYKEIFVCGAGVKLPRSKPLHWRHAKQNVKDFHESCVRESNRHYTNALTRIEYLRKELKAEREAQIAKEETAKKSTNLSKFLVNVEARIYAQLSKQLADQMFAEGGGTQGSMDFQGTSISWVKTGTDVTLTIVEANGGRTEITVPIASFAF